MKYKLINLQTKEEHLCDNVRIDGLDYFVSDEKPNLNDYAYSKSFGLGKIIELHNELCFYSKHKSGGSITTPFERNLGEDCKKVIATTNLNMDIPQALNEIEISNKIHNWVQEVILKEGKEWNDQDALEPVYYGIIEGYNKCQETHPFSEDDVREIFKIAQMQKNYGDYKPYTFEEAIQLWKEQQIKIIYYV